MSKDTLGTIEDDIRVETTMIFYIMLKNVRLISEDNGKVIKLALTEEQAKNLINNLSNRLGIQISNKVKPEKLSLNRYTTLAQLKDRVLPIGYEEIGRQKPDPKYHGKDSTYVYGKNKEGVYGFRIINGKMSHFHEVGRLNDDGSIINKVLRIIPYEFVNRKQIWESVNHTYNIRLNGQHMKAVLDILEIEGYITTKFVYEPGKGKIKFYARTNKRFNELGVESKMSKQLMLPPTQ